MATSTNLKDDDSSSNYYVILMVQNLLKNLNTKISKKIGIPEAWNANLKQTTTAKRLLFVQDMS